VQASVAEARGLVARALAAAVVAAAGKVGLVEDVEGAGTAAGMAAEMGSDFPASGAASGVAGLATGSVGYTGWPMAAGETATGARKVADDLDSVARTVAAGAHSRRSP